VLPEGPAGAARAERLAFYIPATFGRPDFVFAAAVAKDSVRSYLTMRPLCDAIGIPLDAAIKGKKYGDLATKLLSDTAFADSLVVACWSHNELPKLADALNARKGDYPDPWDDRVFNLILQLDYGMADEPTFDDSALLRRNQRSSTGGIEGQVHEAPQSPCCGRGSRTGATRRKGASPSETRRYLARQPGRQVSRDIYLSLCRKFVGAPRKTTQFDGDFLLYARLH
jgi:hypothetical protein